MTYNSIIITKYKQINQEGKKYVFWITEYYSKKSEEQINDSYTILTYRVKLHREVILVYQ